MSVATTAEETRQPTRRATRALVAHVVPEYLPRSATFIHTLLTHQTRFRALVLAEVTSHLDEFPIERALALGEQLRPARRLTRAFRRVGARRPSPYARRVADEAARAGCALIHAHFGWSGRDSVEAARRLEIPLVTTFYGRDISEASRARRSRPYAELFEHGSLFVVEGPAMADHVSRIGCPAERTRVVPIGIDLDLFPFAERPRGTPFVAVQAARFVEKKGFDLSIRAFAAARHDLGPSELWLVGGGPERSKLERLVAELGIADAVRFPGLVSHAEYAALVSQADVALQPSRTASDGDTEGGAPTVILELQALGIPVVAARHADIPFVVPRPDELVAEEDVDALADALLRVAGESDASRQERVREARAFVERQHDARVTAAFVESLYDEVLA